MEGIRKQKETRKEVSEIKGKHLKPEEGREHACNDNVQMRAAEPLYSNNTAEMLEAKKRAKSLFHVEIGYVFML